MAFLAWTNRPRSDRAELADAPPPDFLL